jgi:hypothetical protein
MHSKFLAARRASVFQHDRVGDRLRSKAARSFEVLHVFRSVHNTLAPGVNEKAGVFCVAGSPKLTAGAISGPAASIAKA